MKGMRFLIDFNCRRRIGDDRGRGREKGTARGGVGGRREYEGG
jgi:hypothetical protein